MICLLKILFWIAVVAYMVMTVITLVGTYEQGCIAKPKNNLEKILSIIFMPSILLGIWLSKSPDKKDNKEI